MSYDGLTYVIPCLPGGYNNSPNLDLIKPESMVFPTKNIALQDGGRAKRGGTAKVNSTAVMGTPQIMGLFDFRLVNGNQFLMFAGNDGAVYKNFTTTIKTGMSTTNKYWFEVMDNTLYIFDGATVPQFWDGSAASTSAVTNPAADWSGSNRPKYGIKHGRGASERMIAFGCPNNPHSLYLSASGNGKEYVTGVVKIDIETGDGFGIVAGTVFGDRFIGFGKRKAYILDDTNSDTSLWGYQAAQWEGGVAHQRLLIKTPNFLVAFTEDGDIYNVNAVQDYGDYKEASLARPSYIHTWIRENVNLSNIDNFHGIYDPVIRAVRIWVTRFGQSQNDTCLVFYLDRPIDEAWMIEDNQVYASGHRANVAALYRNAAGDVRVLTGDYSGFTWRLNSSSKSDDGNGYDTRWRTPQLPFDNPRTRKLYRRGRAVFAPQGNYTVNVNWWADGVQQTMRTISTVGQGAAFGSGLFGTAVFGGQEINEASFELGAVGKRIQVEFENSNAGEDFFISQGLIDHEPLGAQP